MKKLILIGVAIFLVVTLTAQIGRYPFAVNKFVVTGGAVYTDDLEAYSAGGLAGQGNWVYGLLDMNITDDSGNNIVSSAATSGNYAVVKYNATFADNHYSQAKYITEASGFIGVGVRLTGSGATLDGYMLLSGSVAAAAYLGRFDDGVWTQIGTGAITIVIGDVIELSGSGDELSCLLNGSLITTIGTNGVVTDATYSSGVAAIGAYTDLVNIFIDDWEGGDN